MGPRGACLAFGLAAAGCAAAPAPVAAPPAPPGIPEEEVLRVLDARSEILEAKILFWWVESGIEPLRAGLRAIRDGEPPPREVPEEEARRRAAEADVVIVADLHDLDPCRFALGRALESLADPEALAGGRVALVLESIPAGDRGTWFEPVSPAPEYAVMAARGLPPVRGARPIEDLLRHRWYWPILAMADVLERPALRKVTIYGSGPGLYLECLPACSVEDSLREPIPGGMTVEDFKYGGSFYRTNDGILGAAEAWVRGAPAGEGRRRAFVLVGAAHILGDRNLFHGIGEKGLKALVLVPFLPEWEAALRRRFGPGAAANWYEVLPGVLRAPLVRDREILALPPPRPRPPSARGPAPRPPSRAASRGR